MATKGEILARASKICPSFVDMVHQLETKRIKLLKEHKWKYNPMGFWYKGPRIVTNYGVALSHPIDFEKQTGINDETNQ